jgi:hypothetical protein
MRWKGEGEDWSGTGLADAPEAGHHGWHQGQCGQTLGVRLSGILAHSNMVVHEPRQGGASLSSGMWTPLESKTVLEEQFEAVGPGQCRIHPEEWRSPPLEPKAE